MDVVINSKKLNVCASFYTRAGGKKAAYLFLEYPDHPGVLGYQLFDKKGDAIYVTEENARAVAYKILKKNPVFFRLMTKQGYKKQRGQR